MMLLPFCISLWSSNTSLPILRVRTLESSNWDVSKKQYYGFSPPSFLRSSIPEKKKKKRLPIIYFDWTCSCVLRILLTEFSFLQRTHPYQLIHLNGCENLFSDKSKRYYLSSISHTFILVWRLFQYLNKVVWKQSEKLSRG